MFSTPQLQPAKPFRRLAANRWVAASVALHILVIGLLLYHRQPTLKATQLPGNLNGSRLLLTYDPGTGSKTIAALQRPPETPKLRPAQDTLPSLQAPAPPPPTVSAPATSLSANNSSGNDALGQGDIKIASLLAHPVPAPDLSRLPSGTRGDVIVDIVIDPNGHIAKFTMQRGLGHGVDETVLATIQQWTFQPATRNGIPVSSEQELLFHYERG
jgi:periplasmic protein TonB